KKIYKRHCQLDHAALLFSRSACICTTVNHAPEASLQGAIRAPLAGLRRLTQVAQAASFPPLKTMKAAVRLPLRETETAMKYLLLELKICEGCGMLWLRRKEPAAPYCSGCIHRL